MLTLLMHSGVLALLAAFMIAAATGEPAEPSWSDIMPEGPYLDAPGHADLQRHPR